MTLGDCIKEYRDRHGLSQRQFAELCGLSNAYVSILEKNVNPKTGEAPAPTYGVYQKVAEAMEMSVQTLMEKAPDSAVSIGSKMTLDAPAREWHPEVYNLLSSRIESVPEAAARSELYSLYDKMSATEKDKLLDYARYIIDSHKRRK